MTTRTPMAMLRSLTLAVIFALMGSSVSADLWNEVATLPPASALSFIDSLEAEGTIEARPAAVWRFRAMNRTGHREAWFGIELEPYNNAMQLFELDPVTTTEDSLLYCSFLLDCAYYHARCVAFNQTVVDPDEHLSAEKNMLEKALLFAPIPWQRDRAEFELARFNAVRTSRHGHSLPDRADSATALILQIAERSEDINIRGAALWHAAVLASERGRMTEAHDILNLMKADLRGSKWPPRADYLASLFRRHELFLDSVSVMNDSLLLRGVARNLSSQMLISLDSVPESQWLKKGRLPFVGELKGCRPLLSRTLPINADIGGSSWATTMPTPSPGLYRLTIALNDSVLAFTLGIWNAGLSPSDLSKSDRNSASTAIQAGYLSDAGEWKPCPWSHISAHAAPANTDWQALVRFDDKIAWLGPRRWGPSFLVELP